MLTFREKPGPPWPDAIFSAAVFDLDGTITRPVIDFDAIRREIGVEGLILEALETLDDAGRRRAFNILHRHEKAAAENSQLNPGITDLLRLLHDARCPTAIVTRNTRTSVDTVADRHGLRFDAVVTRDDAPAKPSPEPLLMACRMLDVSPADALWIGDGPIDRQAGIAAGIRTVIIRSRPCEETDGVLMVDSAAELAKELTPV